MYNPTRANGNGRPVRVQDPHAGIKHSDIVRRKGVGVTAPASGARINTKHGYMTPLFDCASYVVRYEVMFTANNIGFGVNKKADRTIRVLRGILFATVLDANGDRQTFQIQSNGHLHVPRGTKHSYATSGTDEVELLLIESVDYDKNWESLEEPTVSSAQHPMISQPDVAIPGPTAKRDDTKAHAQAEEMVRDAIIRRQPKRQPVNNKPANPNSAAQLGVNPRPAGAKSFSDD